MDAPNKSVITTSTDTLYLKIERGDRDFIYIRDTLVGTLTITVPSEVESHIVVQVSTGRDQHELIWDTGGNTQELMDAAETFVEECLALI